MHGPCGKVFCGCIFHPEISKIHGWFNAHMGMKSPETKLVGGLLDLLVQTRKIAQLAQKRKMRSMKTTGVEKPANNKHN